MPALIRGWILTVLICLLAGLTIPPVPVLASGHIHSNDLRISQVYGGGGNLGALYKNDFIELFNAGTSPIDLGGWSVQYSSAAGVNWQKTDLAGVIEAGQYYLIHQAAGTGGTTDLPAPDAIGTMNLSATAGKLALVRSTTSLSGACPSEGTVVDLVGYGSTANCYEGSHSSPAPSNTTALIREDQGCTDSDDNAADFNLGSPNPRNRAAPPYSCSAPRVTNTSPTDGAIGIAGDAPITVTFNQPVTTGEAWYTLTCNQGGAIASVWGGTGLTRRITPAGNLLPGDLCTVTILKDRVANAGSEVMMADYVWSFTVTTCGEPSTPINLVQGSTLASPHAGEEHSLEGIVTFRRNLSGELGGFFMQSLPSDDDGDSTTSEGIFVFTGANPDYIFLEGDHVRVTGRVVEWNSGWFDYGRMDNMTQISNLSSLEVCASGLEVIPVEISLPFLGDPAIYLERYEGMFVRVSAIHGLYVQQNYFQGRFGQLTIAAGGELMRIFNPNNGNTSLSLEKILQSLIVLDDGLHEQNPNPIPYYSSDGALRAGDQVAALTGVLDQGRINSAPASAAGFPNVYYRLHPLDAPAFQPVNPRSTHLAPPEVGGDLKIVSFNLRNFFTTLNNGSPPAGSPYSGSTPPRGADTIAELQRQEDKLVAALHTLDADVVGLIEVEAWSGAGAIEALVNALNSMYGGAVYAAITDPPGFPQPPLTDIIKVALIYKPANVSPLGAALMDNDPIYNRIPVAQTFRHLSSAHIFSVVVNHFKSKGGCPSNPADSNADFGQGCWNERRMEQATRLLDFISVIVMASGDPDVLVLGDLNAYGAEDPVTVLANGGLVNQVARYVDPAWQYSYIFNGQAGYLDHALATASLSTQISGAAFWHINADEPALIDYNMEFKPVDYYSPHPFRSSDHDPLLTGLAFGRGEGKQVFLPLVRR